MKAVLPLTQESFRSIILSHGWYALAPFQAQTSPPMLTMTFNRNGIVGAFEISCEAGEVILLVKDGTIDECVKTANECLSLDVDLMGFYGVAEKVCTSYGWIAESHMGRFLKSPTLFEDCCKALMTTNTTWQRTSIITRKIVEQIGTPLSGRPIFPSPEKIMAFSEQELKNSIGCGFRARYLLGLCERTLDDPNTYLGSSWKLLSNRSFYETVLEIKGIGDVTANYLCLMYGKPYGYNIDAYVTRRCKELWGEDLGDLSKFISTKYQGFGEFAPLALWLELTRHWHLRDSDSSNEEW